MYGVDELEWLLSQLMTFKKVIEVYGLIGNVQEYVQPLMRDRDSISSRTEGTGGGVYYCHSFVTYANLICFL